MSARCVECERIRSREYARYRRANPRPGDRERKLIHDRSGYLKHKEARISQNREYRAANADKIRAYAKTETRKLIAKRSQQKHIDRVREYDKRYRVAKRDELNRKVRERHAADPSVATARSQRRRALEANAPGPGVTAEQWRQILELHDNRCAYCLVRDGRLKMDHVVALVRGGEHSPDNVVPTCSTCNSSKRDKSLLEIFQPHLKIAQRMTAAQIPTA